MQYKFVKVKSTKYSTETTVQKTEKYVKVWERKTYLLVCLCYTSEGIFCKSLLKIVMLFLTNLAMWFI